MSGENVRNAENLVGKYFSRFSDKISLAERNEFFDPRNRDMWTREFARFLEKQIDPDRPSND